jgi:hypothetical protein
MDSTIPQPKQETDPRLPGALPDGADDIGGKAMTTVEIGYGKHPHSIPPELSPHNPAKLTMPKAVVIHESRKIMQIYSNFLS